jgi:hypothetical protein
VAQAPSTNVFVAHNVIADSRSGIWVMREVAGATLRNNTAKGSANGNLLDEGRSTDTSLAFTEGGEVKLGATGNVAVGPVTPHSQLHVQGSLAFKVVRATTDLTLADQDYIVLADASQGNVVITLPSAVGIAGRIYEVKRVTAGANVVVVQTAPGETIEGAPL